jgi:phage head maturation protease
MEVQKEITTPIGSHKVVIKTMLTGAERERVDAAEMSFVKTEDGQKFTVTDMAKMTTAKKHKLLEVSVVSIDGDATDVLGRLQKMYEPDYAFVFKQVEAEQKKMTASISKV